ncbi:flagellar biosynthetic protein FliO [Nocardioides sp. LML1-1-1.1]|uniref:flagellar biosynthetic protein FliO n=1 Tax=Nocardioides sp. LML1-1-1.1 TaxID=3135248 RepID=UPI003428463F
MIALSASDPSIGALAFRLLGSLAVVVGLLLLIARGVNRRFKAPSGAAIQVVHRQALGRGQGVAVVSVGTRVLVLGTTEQQVTLLTEVEPDEVGLDVLADGGLGPAPGDDEDDEDDDGGQPPVRTAPAATGPLAGSVLSAQTWKQTLAAVTGKRAS